MMQAVQPTQGFKIKVPAKLNLFLHITGRRADGYHNLQSIFVPIDCYDELEIVNTTDGHIHREGGLAGLEEQDDLVVRAAQLLKIHAAREAGASIRLVKHIPSGAGMGGGSADAAYTLLALRSLWNLPLTDADLAAIGLRLGADVPFFLTGKAAFVEGIGEQITPLPLPKLHAVVIKPTGSLLTAKIFTAKDLTRDSEQVKISVFGFADVSFLEKIATLRNDMQAVAESLCPDVKKAGELLDTACRKAGIQAKCIRMTGSGSAVFALLGSQKEALIIENWVKTRFNDAPDEHNGWFVQACSTLNNTSLQDQAVRV